MKKTMQALKQEAVQNAIFEAAIELFSRKGFNETTVDEIAELAGVSQRSFFRYFPTKADVLGYGIPRNGDVLVEAVSACPAGMAEIEVIRTTVRTGIEFSMKQPWTRQIIDITARNEPARQAHASKIGELELRLTKAYAAWLKEPDLESQRAWLLSKLTIMVHNLTMGAWYFTKTEDCVGEMERVLGQIAELVKEVPLASGAARDGAMAGR